jgi:hypothetical protein
MKNISNISTVERVLQSPHLAHPKRPQRTLLLRIGQLCGSTYTGHWSTDDMWPIMIASSCSSLMNCIPSFPKKTVDWIPVDVAAQVIVELLLAEKDPENEKQSGNRHGEESRKLGRGYTVHNIVNPNRTPWSDLVSMLRTSLASTAPSNPPSSLQEVPLSAWVSQLTHLADQNTSPTTLPALKLLQFFENMAVAEAGHQDGGTNAGTADPIFLTSKSEQVSGALRSCEPFCQSWMDANVARWREGGFL